MSGKTKPDCRTCIYRAGKGSPNRCDYAMLNRPHTRKAQPPSRCTYYVEGPQIELTPREKIALLDRPGTCMQENQPRKPRTQRKTHKGPESRYDWDLALKLHQAGKTTREIAEGIGSSYETVRKWRKQLGTGKREKPGPKGYNWERAEKLHADGATNQEIAAAMGCTVQGVYAWLRRTGRTGNRSEGRGKTNAG